MGRKGRPKGQQSKTCLIKDDLISPFEVHIDNHNYILFNSKTNVTEGYYSNLAYTLKAVLKKQFIPTGNDEDVYTIEEYITAMQSLRDEMAELLVPAHHKL